MKRFAAFGNRNFRLYFIGQTISSIGSWAQSLAVTWLVLELTNRSDQLGIALALQFLPMLILGAPAGVLADRLDNRRVLLATSATSGVLALTFGIVVSTGHATIWLIYALPFLLGLVLFVGLLGAAPEARSINVAVYQWMATGAWSVDFGLLVDPLSILFVLLITGVGSLIHIYSLGYMADDPDKRRFMGYLNLFVAAMLLLESVRLTKNAIALPFVSTARTPLTGQVTPGRQFTTAAVAMERVDAIRARTRSTLNHVALTCLDGALRRYLVEQNALPEQPPIAACPVAMPAA